MILIKMIMMVVILHVLKRMAGLVMALSQLLVMKTVKMGFELEMKNVMISTLVILMDVISPA